ncbi:ubx domain-containing protein [Stemphylium lycopersici]|nr:ubx domain-containing protein [Stemphylium lycopersici]
MALWMRLEPKALFAAPACLASFRHTSWFHRPQAFPREHPSPNRGLVANMFHQGSLQSGIALAIQEQKLVACFVRDGGATSKEWEEEWLASGWLSSLLAQKAILLRLEAGSTEAGFLAAFSDLSQTPTFVVIHNGQLQVQLKSNVNKNDFINSVRKVLGANPIPGSSVPPTSPPQASTPDPRTNTAAEDDLYGTSEPSIPVPAAPTPPSDTKGKQRAAPAPASKPTASSTSTNKAQQEARDALRKKKREDAEELARIKARIEADKAARKAEAETRRAEREKERNAQPSTSLQPPTITSSKRSQAKTVSLNVRLFDGRTIRSTFPRDATLQDAVRTWVDSEFSKLAQSDENINHKALPPYYFRHILAPQPSRELSAGDETAADVQQHQERRTELATGGRVMGQRPGANDQPGHDPVLDNATAAGGGQQPGMRVRTLADQRARESPSFYNGNQLSTEPRPEDNDKRD